MSVISDSDLRELIKIEKSTHTGQYIATCPFCGKEGHFYINKVTQVWDCKRCGESGNIYKLLRFFDKLYLVQGTSVEVRETIRGLREVEEAEEETLTQLPEISMPVGWKPFSKPNAYLQGRGVTLSIAQRYEMGETRMLSKFKNYILIPIRDEGRICGFIGRYADKHVPDGKLRYNNSVGTQFAQLLFGYDEITDNTKTVVLVEGVFDKIAVDRYLHLWNDELVRCCCTFGKKISSAQILKLKQKKIRRVVLLYDFDAVKEMKKYGIILNQDFITDIVFTTKKDIDECTPEEAIAVFERTYKPDDFNVDVIGKLKRK